MATDGRRVRLDARERRRRGRRRRRDHHRRGPDAPLADDPIAQAERVADAKARVMRDGIFFLGLTLFLSLFIGRLAWIIGIFLCLPVLKEAVRHWVEPTLRERWVEREVSRHVDHSVRSERRHIETTHHRDIEELAAGVAHEIRNPISAAKSLVQQMGEDPGARGNVEYAQVALDELGRVEKSISHLLRFAREREFAFEPVAVDELVESAARSFSDRVHELGAELRIDVDEAGDVRADPEKLRRAVVNLIGNALDAAANEPLPRVTVSAGSSLAGDLVWLRVRDNGPGIPAERVDRIWSPFFTSKDEGTGLGLAITRKLIEGHGGSIEIERTGPDGTSFVVTLARDGSPIEPEATPTDMPAEEGR